MSSLMSIAAAGVRTGAQLYQKSAAAVVKAATPGSGDLAGAVVGETTNRLAFKADIEVFKMADEMTGKLLDIMA